MSSPGSDLPAIRGHVPALDGLRGLAIVMVIAYHAGAFKWGWIGVDLFFVLSGYLITNVLLESKTDPRFFRNFYARRTLRIFPLYYLFVGLTLLNRVLVHDGTPGGWWALIFMINWRVVLVHDWHSIPNGLGHLWTLAIEEQFYLLWPLLVRTMTRSALSRLCVFVAVFTLCMRVLIIVPVWNLEPFSTWQYNAVYVSTPTRIDSLLIGAWFALRPAGAARAPRYALPVALAAIAALFMGGTEPMLEPEIASFGFSLVAVTAVLALQAALYDGLVARIFRAPLLQAVGRRSYAMYLFHLAVIAMLSDLGMRAGLLTGIVAGAVVYGVAEITWRTIEAPALSLKRYFPRGGTGRNSGPPVIAAG